MATALKSKTPKTSIAKARNKTKIDPQINELAQKRLGSTIAQVKYPGGKSRRSCRIILRNGNSAIVTKRRTLQRSKLECKALESLTQGNQAVPELLGSSGRIIFQQDVGDQRLSEQLNKAKSSDQLFSLLDNALEGLRGIQQHASTAGLDIEVPVLGRGKTWRREFADRPRAIGDYFAIKAPKIDVNAVVDRISVRKPRFVKWDSRPGNALVTPQQQVIWIDWEHCGARNRLDDLAWLLTDEYVADDVDVEHRLLQKHVPEFADDLDTDFAYDYLMTYGVLHMCVRLGLILDRKKGKDWWDEQYCISGDKIGVTRKMARRQCQRAARWARNSQLLDDLGDWFEQIDEAVLTL